MRNKKDHSKNSRDSVPRLLVASINLFPKEEKNESNNKSANKLKSTNLGSENKRSTDPPEFYQAKIKPKNFDPL